MRTRSLTIILSCIALCLTARAEEYTDSTSHLDEVVVTARSLESDAIPAQRISGEELKRMNSNSIADALCYF